MLREILGSKEKVIMNTHATWLLKTLTGWKAYLMIQGRLYGPIEAAELPKLGITKGRKEGAIISFTVNEKEYSLVRDGGFRISEMDSLDCLYEVMTE